jgi:hypothetical protein
MDLQDGQPTSPPQRSTGDQSAGGPDRGLVAVLVLAPHQAVDIMPCASGAGNPFCRAQLSSVWIERDARRSREQFYQMFGDRRSDPSPSLTEIFQMR